MKATVRFLCVLSLTAFCVACGGGGGGGDVGGGGGGGNPVPPGIPTGVSLQPTDSGITVTWNAVADATSYNIYIASSAGLTKDNYSTLPDGAKITSATSPHDVAGLTNGTTYFLIVTALNAGAESGGSAEAFSTPLPVPVAPIGLKGTSDSSQITITWDAVPFADSYNLYIANESGVTKLNFMSLVGGFKVVGATSPHVINGLNNEQKYLIVVTAENTVAEGTESLELVGVPGKQGWISQNPTPTGNELNDVEFVDTLNGWIVGNGGTILRTIDGGSTWSNQWDGASLSFLDVSALDASNAWVVARYGRFTGEAGYFLLNTTDGGTTWINHAAPAGASFLGVDFISATTGWVVGDSGIYHTNDGGDTWTIQNSSNIRFAKVKFVDSNNGWAIGTSTVHSTSDGGTTWSSQNLGRANQDIDFIDINNGWIADHTATGAIYATTSGGTTWGAQPTSANFLTSIAFGDATGGWAVGTFGKIVHTSNGGGSWAAQTSGVTRHLRAVSAVNSANVWVVGAGGTILNTTNGGTTWNLQSSNALPIYSGVSRVDFVDSSNGWVVVGGLIVHTSDGGLTWSQVTGLSPGLFDVDFVNLSTGWAVGGSQILHTTDGGTTWSNQNSNGATNLTAISFVNTTTGWAIGTTDAFKRTPVIRKTVDGGANWLPQFTGTTTIVLHDFAFADANTGWAVGEGGIILHTTDGGANWLAQLSGVSNSIRGIYALDATTAWAVGGNSSGTPMVILKTSDGVNWLPQSTGKNGVLNRVFFADALNGWMSESEGQIYATQDGGDTWQQQSSGISGHGILGFSFVNSTTGWFVGGAGTPLISKTTSGGFAP